MCDWVSFRSSIDSELVLGVVFTLIMTFFSFGVYYYLPHHLHFIYGRAKYYLLGDEGAPLVVLWSQALGEL